MHAQAVGTAPLDELIFACTEGEHEQLIDILASFWEDRQRIFSVNLPTKGLSREASSGSNFGASGCCD